MKNAKTPRTVLVSRLYEFKILRIDYLLKILIFIIVICSVPIIFALFFGNINKDSKKKMFRLEYKNRKIMSYLDNKSDEKQVYYNFDDHNDLNISLSDIPDIGFEERIYNFEIDKTKIFDSKKNRPLSSLKYYHQKINEYNKLKNFIEIFEIEREKKRNHLEMQDCKKILHQKLDDLLEIISKMEKSKIELKKKERELHEIESYIEFFLHKNILFR